MTAEVDLAAGVIDRSRTMTAWHYSGDKEIAAPSETIAQALSDEEVAERVAEFTRRKALDQAVLDAVEVWEQIPGWAECEDYVPVETQALLEAVRARRQP